MGMVNDMRSVDADALDEVLEKIPAADIKNIDGQAYVLVRLSQVFNVIKNAPTIEPERKKDTIQKFHDYQVEWLLSHCDLELEPQLEEWVVRFLHDTANCYMMEIDREEGE